MSAPLRRTPVAIVGAGFIADFHLQILDRIKDVEVVAVVDADLQRAEQMARRFSCPSWFASIADMAKVVQPKIAHILVPPHLHGVVVEDALQHGMGVFVEKPIATDMATCQRLVQLAKEKQLPLNVNHNNVFHPSFCSLQELIESGKIGRIQHLFVSLHVPLRQLDAEDFRHWMFQEPRNIVFEQGPHPFSQIFELLGPAKSVTTTRSGKRILGPGLTFYDTWQVALQCEKGPATVLLSFGKDFAENWIRAVGQDGVMEVDLLRRHSRRLYKTPWLDFYDQFKIAWTNGWRGMAQGFGNAANYVLSTLKLRGRTDVFYLGMQGSIEAFYEALRKSKPLPCEGATHGIEVTRFCELTTDGVEAETAVLPMEDAATGEEEAEILVTGATGFLGRHLMQRLQAENKRCRLLVRQPKLVPERLRGPGISLIEGDLSDEEAIRKAVRGVKTVIHMATGGGDSWAEVEASMIGGAERIAKACVDEKVPHLIFTSTIACLYLGDSSAAPVTEQTEIDPQAKGRALYARGKIACEKRLQQIAYEKGLAVTILRPGVVVGEGGLVQHSGVGLWTRDSQCFGWGFGNNDLPFVLASDVADAIVRVASRPPKSAVYNLVGDAKMTAREWVETLRRRCGRDFQFHGQPLWWFQTIEIFKWLVKVAIRRPNVTFPSYRDLKTRALVRRFDNSLPKKELGWEPVADVQKFIELAIGWYVKRDLEVPPTPESNMAVAEDREPERLPVESGVGPIS